MSANLQNRQCWLTKAKLTTAEKGAGCCIYCPVQPGWGSCINMCMSVCVQCLPARVLSVYCRLYCPAVREMKRTERFTIMKHCVEYLTHTRARIDTHTYAQNSRLHPYLSHSALSEVSVGAYLDRGRALGPVR